MTFWSKAWIALCLGAAAAAMAGEAPAPAPPPAAALALWFGAGRPEADERPAPGPADAAHLAAAWNFAGGVSQSVTGEVLSSTAVFSQLLRLRAAARSGDVVVVGYSGPAAVKPDTGEGRGRLWLKGFADGSDDGRPTLEDTLFPALADGAFHAAIVVIGHDRIAAAGDAADAWQPVGGLPGAAGSFHLWAGAAPGKRTEMSGLRSTVAAALAWELGRRGAPTNAASLDDWLRAAARRLSLETADRQTPVHFSSAASAQPAGGAEADCRDSLLRVAETIERDAGAADVAAALAAAARATEDAGQLGLSALLLTERRRRADSGAERTALAMEIAEIHARRERWSEAARWAREAAAEGTAGAAPMGLLAAALWRAGNRLEAAMAASKALQSSTAAGDAAEERGRARAHIVAGGAARVQGQAAAARRELEAAWEAAERDPALLPAGERLDLCVELGAARSSVGDPAGAESAYHAAIGQARALGRTARIPPLLASIGDARMTAGRPAEAIEAWREAVEAWPSDCSEPAPADLLVRLGEALSLAGRREEAMRWLNDALARLGDGADLAVQAFRVHRAMSRLWLEAGDDLRALHHAREAMETSGRIAGFPVEELAHMAADLSALYARRNEPARSADFARRSIDLWSRAAQTNLPSLAAAWILYGSALGAQERHADAAAAWSNAAVFQAAAFPGNSLQWARTRLREGRAWIESGRPELAQSATEAVASLVRRPESGATPRDVAEALVLYGRAHAMQERNEEAARALDDAVAAADGGGEATAGLLVEALVWRAAAAAAQGRFFEARAALARAAPLLTPATHKDLRSLNNRVLSAVNTALQPHGPLGRAGDMAVYEAIETERRIRETRPRRGSDR